MSLQIDNSRDRYNQIWRPRQSLVNYFLNNNAATTENLLRLLELIRRYDYDLSFTLSREPDALANIDWASFLRDVDRSKHFSRLFVRNKSIVVPGSRKNGIFASFCRSFIAQSDPKGTSLFFDIGCGTGNWLFEFLVLEGRSAAPMCGIDLSETAVETASSISDWMGFEQFSFSVDNLAKPASTQIDCGGRDVVFFSISVLNKIRTLDSAVFQILQSRIRNHGRVRFVHIESFGWQVYRDKKINAFFAEMDQTINDLGGVERGILRQQIQENERSEATDNLNLAKVIQNNVETGILEINFFQAHAIALRAEKPYSVVTLTLA